MAIITETFISCDNCGVNFGVDDRTVTGMHQRQRARNNGWVYSYNKDLCPDCRPKRKDGHNIKTRRTKK